MNLAWFLIRALEWGYTEKEFGFMTLKKFNLLHEEYKNKFDIELILTLARKTYEEATRKLTIDDVIPE